MAPLNQTLFLKTILPRLANLVAEDLYILWNVNTFDT